MLNSILEDNYLIKPNKVLTQQGGWASLAYKIEDSTGALYFLKVYEKNRKSTSYLTEHMDVYLPIVDWLHNHTPLKGKIIRMIKTQNQNYTCEDENYVYILFDYIEGTTVGENFLTKEEVLNLADIISQLHNIKDVFSFDIKADL